MSRSRSRRDYDEYEDDSHFEQFKNRRQSKQKKRLDREMFNEEREDANIHNTAS